MRLLFVFGGIAILSLCALAQQYPQQQPASNTTQAGSTAGATAVIDQSGSTVPRSFIGATPGVITPGVFPGIPVPNSDRQLYWPAAEHRFTMEEINRMKRKFHLGDILPENWKIRIRSVVIDPDEVKPNNDPIELVDWWANTISYRDDRVVGRVTILCDYLQPEELCLGLGLEEAKKKTHTNRVSVGVRMLREGVTRGLSFGAGGAGSRITEPGGIGNDGAAVATGALIGTNRVRVEDYLEFEILCLNIGSIVPPALPQQPQQVQAQALPPAPLMQTVRLEIPPIKIDLSELRVALSSLLPPQPAQPAIPIPTPPQPSQDSCDASGMPDLVVLFDFDRYLVKSEYLPKLQEFVGWLASHPKCHIQVEGHTCKSGTYDYDAILGRHRAKAVYEKLIVLGGKPEQIKQFVSVSKDKIAYLFEQDPLNRRVIFRIIGPATGK